MRIHTGKTKRKIYKKNEGFIPHHFSFLKSSEGFTLVELIVTFTIFVLITGAAFNLLVSGISNQRNVLAKQILIDQTSFFTEYMNRALRQAQKDISGTCISSGYNYEIGGVGDSIITFIGLDPDKNKVCRRFLFEGTEIKEQISTDDTVGNLGASQTLTSDEVEVVDAIFTEIGASQTDNQQPRITFTLDLRAAGFDPDEQPAIRLQTSISQRNIDVQQ